LGLTLKRKARIAGLAEKAGLCYEPDMGEQDMARGAQIRRQVAGASHVDRTAREADPFLAPFFELATEHVWGALWARPGLDVKYRSLVVVAALAAMGRLHELRTHLRGARNVGWTADELREALLQLGGYAGYPAAIEALRVLAEVVKEERF
jgi:4-carboxymuconolactone decarboxylase